MFQDFFQRVSTLRHLSMRSLACDEILLNNCDRIVNVVCLGESAVLIPFCTSYSYWMAEFLTQGCRGWLQSSRHWPSCCTAATPSSLLPSFVTKELMSLEDNFLQNLNKSLLEAQEMWTLIRTSKPKMMKAYGSSNSGLSILDSNQMLKFCSSVEASNCLLLMLTMILFANFIIHGWWIYT